MSPHFKSFLKGLLNKLPHNRLTWSDLLEHPFVKETSDELEVKELAVTRGYEASWQNEENQKPTVSSLESGLDYKSASNLPDHAQIYNQSSSINPHPAEEFPGFSSTTDNKQSGYLVLDKLENNSRTIKGAELIGKNNETLTHILLPLKRWSEGSQISCRDQYILISSQSLKILSNLVAASSTNSSGLADEIIRELLVFNAIIISIKSSEVNDLIVKSFSIIRTLLYNCGGGIASSYLRHWIALAEVFSQVVGRNEDTSGRVVYEASACVAIMLSRVAQGFRVPSSSSSDMVCGLNETLKKILDHEKTAGMVDHLCVGLAISGSGLVSGSSSLTHAACEVCKALWSLIDAFEILLKRENH